MDTQALLDEFRALDFGLKKRTQEIRWRQAEIVYALTPGQGQSPQPGQYTLDQLAEETEYSVKTLGTWRRMWERYGLKGADSASLPNWTTTYAEVDGSAPMRERMAAYDIDRLAETATPAQKVAVAAKLLADQDVIAAADDLGSPISQAAMHLVKVSERRSEARTRAVVDDSPVVQEFDRATALMRIGSALVSGAAIAQAALKSLRDVELDPRYTQGYGLLREGITRWEEVLEDARALRDTGKTPLDRFIAQALKGS